MYISGLNTRQFVSVEARLVVILRGLVVMVVGSSRLSEPVVIIGEMSNTVTKEYSFKKTSITSSPH